MTDSDLTEIARARAAARVRFADVNDRDTGEQPDTVDPDNPSMTEAQLAALRPATDVVPHLVAARLRRRGETTTVLRPDVVSVRLDSDVIEALQSSGEGWQGRINDLLRGALAIGPDAMPKTAAPARLENMGDVVRRAVAGGHVAPDEVRRMAEAVQRHIASVASGDTPA